MLPKKPCFLQNCNFSSLTTNFDKFWCSLFTVAKILNKLTYASFKNVSALILSISPPGGSLSNFFTPIVSSPVQKTIENKVYKLSRYHIISLQFNVLHLCHSLKLVLAPLNTFNSQILLVILLIVFHLILTMLVQRICFCFILVTFLIDPVLILRGEIQSWSLTGVKELRRVSSFHKPGREINFFSDCHLAPKFFKVVANSKKVGCHFQRQTKPFFTLSVL